MGPRYSYRDRLRSTGSALDWLRARLLNIALIQPSSAFMERVFSILRAYCMDERQASSFSDRIAAAALLKYNRGRGKLS